MFEQWLTPEHTLVSLAQAAVKHAYGMYWLRTAAPRATPCRARAPEYVSPVTINYAKALQHALRLSVAWQPSIPSRRIWWDPRPWAHSSDIYVLDSAILSWWCMSLGVPRTMTSPRHAVGDD